MIPLKKGDIIKGCNYSFIREKSVECLKDFKLHKRLKVFFNKGLACVTPNCKNVGTRFICARGGNGGHNWDIFTDDLVMLTVDHIVAKKNGGGNELDNLQPMCSLCNSIKGHQDISLDELWVQVEMWHKKKIKEAEKKRNRREYEKQCRKDRNDPVVIARKQEERKLKRELLSEVS